MHDLSCGILLYVACPNPMGDTLHGHATGKAKQCVWCHLYRQETVPLLRAARLHYIELHDLLRQECRESARGLKQQHGRNVEAPREDGIRYGYPLL
jgi:hypothetical protein